MAFRETFASSLLTENCHHALVELGDGEIKVLEHVKAYVTKQISITEHFVNSMGRLNNSSALSRPYLKENSPFMQVWDVFYADNVNITSALTQMAQTFDSSILGRLDKLVSYCKDIQKHYKAQRFRIDSELKTTCDEKQRLENTYQQHADEVKSATQKIEANKVAGKKGGDKTKQDKLYKSSLKLYQNHNDYVLALTAAAIHQRHYQDGIIPNLMNTMQIIKYDLVLQWKEICVDMAGQIKAFGEQNIKLFDDVHATLELVKDDNPYQNFLQKKGEELQRQPGYEFDECLLSINDTDLEINEIGVYDLTLEQLKSKDSLLEQSVADSKTKLSNKSIEYQKMKVSLQELKDTSNSYDSIFHDQMAVSEVSRELKELGCLHEKLVAQHVLVSSSLKKLNGNPPTQFTNALLSENSESFGSPTERRSNGTLARIKNQFFKISTSGVNNSESVPPELPDNPYVSPVGRTRPLPQTPGQDNRDAADYDEPVEIPLVDELWYHGTISRTDAEALLHNDGDYIVRESSRNPGQYVLSTMWETARHFILQQDDTGRFRLEGEAFPTVTHLLDYHRRHQCPLTKKTSALLVTPVVRRNILGKELRHDNIMVIDKLGRGHFGDVMRGRLLDTKQEVAIKTCRDSVIPSMKEKFLQEAEILGQYNHPNIVKLIGVAIDEEPVYIVMELMEGGDYLKYLRNDGKTSSPNQLIQFTIDAASGMTYLEDKGCIHRDLAARNCLLDKMKNLKISDFGMSREADFYECSNMREIPVKWTAPEALNYSRYTSQSDVWSFGVLLWETYSLGNTPYPGMNNKATREQVDAGFRMPPPLGTPGIVYDLMKSCWNSDPDRRPRFGDVLQRLQHILNLE